MTVSRTDAITTIAGEDRAAANNVITPPASAAEWLRNNALVHHLGDET